MASSSKYHCHSRAGSPGQAGRWQRACGRTMCASDHSRIERLRL